MCKLSLCPITLTIHYIQKFRVESALSPADAISHQFIRESNGGGGSALGFCTLFVTHTFLTVFLSERFNGEPKNLLARNAVTRTELNEVLIDRDVSSRIDHVFSNKIPAEMKATNQRSSGRCWM